MPMVSRGPRVRTFAVIGASAIIFAAMARPAAQGKLYIADDLGSYHLPLRAFYADCLARGDRFTWCPSLFNGFDLHGEGQVGLLHPWHLLLYRTLPLQAAFSLELLASYPALFAGSYLLLRRWGLPRDASGFGAMVFALGGFNVYHYKHLNMVGVIAHLPWLLLLADTALRETDARKAAWARLGVGLLTASQILLGHPQSLVFSGVAEAFYAGVLTARGETTWTRLACWAGAKLLGVALGSAQWLPTWDALGRSVRSTPSRAYVAFGSLPPANLVQWLAPYAYVPRVLGPPLMVPDSTVELPAATTLNDWRAHEFGLYAGAAVPVLLLWLGLRRKAVGRRLGLANAALLLAVLALVLAVGKYTPLFRLCWRLPLFSLFRVPARYVVLVHGAVAVMMAVALADLARVSARRRPIAWCQLWPLAMLPVASLAVSAGVLLASRHWPDAVLAESLASRRALLAGPALVLIASILVTAAARGRRWAVVCLIVFAGLDQGVYAITYLRSFPRVTLPEYLASRKLPPGQPGDRIVRMAPCFDDSQTTRGYSLVTGYAGLLPRRRIDCFKTPCQRVAGARWIELADADDNRTWAPVPDPMPRARLVTHVVASAQPNRDIDTIDVSTTALAERAPAWPPAQPGTAWVLADRPGSIEVETYAESRQLVVLTESFHPGWRAAVDGHGWPVLAVNGDFLGCVVPPGKHRVVFRFTPRSLERGVQLSVLAAVVMAAWLAAALSRRGAEGTLIPAGTG